jgi:hypothetical protein
LQQAENTYKGSMSPARGECKQRYIDRDSGRYQAAIKTQAKVKRLALPIPLAVSVALSGATLIYRFFQLICVDRPHLMLPLIDRCSVPIWVMVQAISPLLSNA